MEVQRLILKQVTLDAPIPPDTFAVSEEVKAKAKTAASEAPHQWVLRRIFLGRFLDSDKIYYPETIDFAYCSPHRRTSACRSGAACASSGIGCGGAEGVTGQPPVQKIVGVW